MLLGAIEKSQRDEIRVEERTIWALPIHYRWLASQFSLNKPAFRISSYVINFRTRYRIITCEKFAGQGFRQ